MPVETTPDTTKAPRLEPIEEPEDLKTKLVYWLTKRQMGKVITPMKVVTARIPKSFRLAYEMNQVEKKGLSLSPELRFLIKSLVAHLNGCSFCIDIARADALGEDVPSQKQRALLDFRSSSVFSERERAALRYAEEATRNRAVSQDTFDVLQSHFSDQEIAEITWLNAMENYYNLINRPLNIGSDELCELARSS